jgi:hypothetical protein
MQAINFCNLRTRQINDVLIHPMLKEKEIENRIENAVERSNRRQRPIINFFKVKL